MVLYQTVSELMGNRGLNTWLNTANYRQTSKIKRRVEDNSIVDHSGVVGAALTTSSFSNLQLASMDWAKATARRDE